MIGDCNSPLELRVLKVSLALSQFQVMRPFGEFNDPAAALGGYFQFGDARVDTGQLKVNEFGGHSLEWGWVLRQEGSGSVVRLLCF